MNSNSGRILFLCTGNFYRSRFAEALFNFEAERRGLGVRAFSRALALEKLDSQDPLSPFTKQVLEKLGIALRYTQERPRAASEEDFQAARALYALKEAEHRPLMREKFPTWESLVEYWHISDLDEAEPEEALPQIAEKISALLASIGSCGESPSR
ncbi:MAG: low molecular weight phosphatase family protein [Opitutales bacterium]|nr:low molecular weight phosphatase family protein [Opitutales bacterium]MCH8540923.1 low molecular weight phosphatase family protein [Opitutales bacterium]